MGKPNGPLYSIGTWDSELDAYTPHDGIIGPSINVPWKQMLSVVRQLRKMGYDCHRVRDKNGEHYSSDPSVIIERTDGEEPEWWKGDAK